ncbi:arginase family protein [Micromonospora sp. NPDC005215]|uniref:arginase family protein n=1 Tax=Micromonospora sp. NPDC005215 TaxID=3157024 RepID=UPI00339FB8A6
MMRRIAVLDAPTNLGLRPPTSTSVPGCAKAPGALRDHELLARLRARDAGCVTPARYDPGDWRPGDGVCHAREIADYSLALAERIGSIIDRGEFPVVLGGDCSVLLGSALAMHRLGEAVGGRIGLVFVDGHSDFRHPGNASYVGAAAGEDLALVTGRGQADLAAIEGRRPYFRDIDVVVLGIRAQDEYRLDLQAAGITTRPVPALRAEGAARTAQWAHEQLADCAGYWVHIDVDVLDPAVMPAVDAPDPGGIAFAELEILLAGLVDTPHCLGVELTVFDPDYDPDGSYAAEIVNTVVAGLAPVTAPEAVPPRLLSSRSTPGPRRANGRAATATERPDRAERLDGLAGLDGLVRVERVAGLDVPADINSAGVGPAALGPAGVGPSVGAVPDDVPAEAESVGRGGRANSEPSGVAASVAPLVEREPVGPPASAGPGLLRRTSPSTQNPPERHNADTA